MTNSAADPFIGQLFENRYQVDELIARGGMANVYKATDLRLGRTVALKILAGTLANDPNFVERFIQEARSTASLMHANVVAVHDQGLALGFPFLVMEYVPGKTIREVLAQNGPFASAHALEIMKSVLAGLAAAHDAGFVHRDIKPENVLITNEGLIKVTDFGLARAISDQPTANATGAVLLGTMAYLSPEQVQQQNIDQRSDVYSSGILLYEMVTGRVPFTGSNPLEVAYKHVNEDVPAPSILQPDIPPAIDHLVLAATVRNINDRLPNARAFQDGVIRALTAVPQAEALTAALPLSGLPLSATQVLPVVTPRGGQALPPRTGPNSGSAIPGQPEIERNLNSFFKTKLRTIIRSIVGILAVVVGAGIWYMFSGTYQTVPNIAGQTLEEASASLTQLSFDFNPIDEFSEEIPVGVVIRTDPEIGKRARVGNPISVFVSKGPERYVIPAEIVGKSPREAEQILKDLNLVVSGTEEIYDDVIEVGKVAATNPAPGASLKRDTPVIIQISKGPEPVEIPAVIGSLLSDVLPMLTTLGFTVVVSEQVFDEVLTIGAVVAIEPEQGSVVPKGSELKVKVSKGPSLISVPNVVGKSVNEATAILQAAGFAVVRENLLPGGAPLNLVYSQSPAANSKVAIGSTIIIKIV